jgi:methylated-DNA-[protein]-cysteine S-methyltransferase
MRKAPSAYVPIFALWQAPIGWFGFVAGERGLVAIVFHSEADEVRRRIEEGHPTASPGEDGILCKAIAQLKEYFRGKRRVFDVPLDFHDLSPFTAAVLRILSQVPFGETLTYGELAAEVGKPHAARAVGRAMAGNPFPIVIPCHRVVGKGGKMTGYTGGEGIATKEWLLRFEQERK